MLRECDTLNDSCSEADRDIDREWLTLMLSTSEADMLRLVLCEPDFSCERDCESDWLADWNAEVPPDPDWDCDCERD